MNTNKFAYWIALGVLALGLSSEYRHCNFAPLHRAVGRADSALCRIVTRAKETLAVARMLTGGERFPVDHLAASTGPAEVAQVQKQVLRRQARAQSEAIRAQVRDQIRAQVDVMRAQAEIRRAQIEQSRLLSRSEFKFASAVNPRISVVCPKNGARIVVNAVPDLPDNLPGVEVDDNF